MIRRCLDKADMHAVQSDGLRDLTATFTDTPVLSITTGCILPS